jgi:hypothetical protein
MVHSDTQEGIPGQCQLVRRGILANGGEKGVDAKLSEAVIFLIFTLYDTAS